MMLIFLHFSDCDFGVVDGIANVVLKSGINCYNAGIQCHEQENSISFVFLSSCSV